MEENNKESLSVSDNIIFLDLGKNPTLKSVEKLMNEVANKLKEIKGEGLALIKSNPDHFSLFDSKFRKKVADKTKEILKEHRFKKTAIYGGNTLSRTATSFVLSAVGIEKVKSFKGKEEALEWLKKP